MRFVSILFFMCSVLVAKGQHNQESRDFFNGLEGCPASLGGWKCMELDLSSETVEQNDSTKSYAYSWNFGDGTRKNGAIIEHCFEAFGSYQVTMDLIDGETATVIRNEFSATVDLYPEVFPLITVITEGRAAGFFEFRSQFGDGGAFSPDAIFWRMDGAHYEGKKVVHSFPAAGTYVVEMAVVKQTDLFGTVFACASTEVTVAESDIWTSGIMESLRESWQEIKSGPFVVQDPMCYVTYNSEGQMHSSVIPLRHLMSQSSLQEGRTYEVMLFSGNLFTEKKKLRAEGLRGSELYQQLKDTVISLVGQPLLSCPALLVSTTDRHVLQDDHRFKQIVKMLLEYPYFKIEVGAYLHTGSRIAKGTKGSLERAGFVRDLLVEQGISSERISIASPENNRSLLNTCSALADCDWENKALDGVIEFRISGIL